METPGLDLVEPPCDADLTAKQELFVLEYLKDFNATQAAIRAGYARSGARTEGSRLLANPAVQAAVAREKAKLAEEVAVDIRFVLRELIARAQLDPAVLLDDEGRLRSVHDMPPEVRRAIDSIEVEELFEGRGEEREQIGTVRKVKFWSKKESLDMLGRYLSMWKDQINVPGLTDLVDRLARGRVRAGG